MVMPTRPDLSQLETIEASVRLESMRFARIATQGARAARPVAPRAEGAPSLEEVSLKQTNSSAFSPEGAKDHIIEEPSGFFEGTDVWRIRTTFYSSGVCEVRASLGNASIGPPAKSSSESIDAVESLSEQEQYQRFESNIQRSRRTLRQKCFELDADHMLTLTQRGKFKSLDELWLAFKEFNRLMSIRFKQWRYVAVPELHADGETYHMHVAIKGFYWAATVRYLWQRALGGTGDETGKTTVGNIDLKSFRRGAGPSRVRKIAGYIAKYIGKGATTCNRSRRLFASSRGLTPYRIERGVCRHWRSVRDVVLAVQGHVTRLGSAGIGTCYFWSRERSDGSPINMGFILSTDWRGVTT